MISNPYPGTSGNLAATTFSHNRSALYVGAAAIFFFFGQLFAGTGLGMALKLTFAIVFGLLSIGAVGGVRTIFGLLNLMIVAKFLLFAIAVKILLLEPSEQNLRAPDATALVMLLGFAGLFIGSALYRAFPKLSRTLVGEVTNPNVYLTLSLLVLVLGVAGYVVGVQGAWTQQQVEVGGIYGWARAFSVFKGFAVVPAILYAWAAGKRRIMTHPLVLGVFAISLIVGILNTGKLDAMEPISCYLLFGILAYGWRYKPLWAVLVAGLAIYVAVVYPYSQYVRSAGAREGTVSDRVRVAYRVFTDYLGDPEFRSTMDAQVTRTDKYIPLYWSEPALTPVSRFAMIASADHLIFASDELRSRSGWLTITWGFKMLLPRALEPDKPAYSAGNYLAHIASDAGPYDNTTTFSYGVAADFYHAFGIPGVVLGCIILFAAFYYGLHLVFGNPRWLAVPSGGTLWMLLLFGYYQHRLAELPVSGLIESLPPLVVLIAMYYMAVYAAQLLPVRTVVRNVHRSWPARVHVPSSHAAPSVRLQ
jgi:hypothetical protein